MRMGKQYAGCVPVRRRQDADGEWEVLMVESRWVPGVWLYPKGGIEEGEIPKVAALRETREEAGVFGKLGPKLGSWKFQASKQVHKMFLLFVEEEMNAKDPRWKERKVRARQWLTFSEAKKLIKKPSKAYVFQSFYVISSLIYMHL